ncbi:hypothetical protein OC835_007099 [Tilletia horrida]|nr:hypothetical protein OC835_007099 [Tilletia horrida]
MAAAPAAKTPLPGAFTPLPTVQTPVASAVDISVNTRGATLLPEEGSHPDQRDSRAIYLPNHVEGVSHIAVDIGGSLAKLVYFTRAPDEPGASELQAAAKSASAKSSLDSSYGTGRSLSVSSDRTSTPPLGGTSPGSTPFRAGTPVASGTLTPTSLHRPKALQASFLERRSLPPVLPGGRLNFVKFETEHIDQCVSFLSELLTLSAKANGVSLEQMRRGVKLTATGGGAHMYKELFERELGIEVQREDEMSCLITGLNFITLIPDEVFWLSDELVEQFRGSDGQRASFAANLDPSSAASQLPRPSPNPPSYQLSFDSSPSPKLPCLLVNIGSGVSIIRVDEYGAFERVSGTSLGGGTLWGLLSLLTGAGSFDEMLALTEEGDNARVDMLVGDIYGQVGYNTLGLKSTTIASSFGKVFRRQSSEESGDEEDGPLNRDRAPGVKSGPSEGEEEETREHAQERRNRERKRKQQAFRPEDICKSLLYAISNNIGQIAYMNAEKYGLDRIYFSGCFIRGHHATINTLSYAIRFWSKGTKRALFLRHEGYLGAVGAWIRQVGGEGSAPITANGSSAPKTADGYPFPTRPEPVRTTSSHSTFASASHAGLEPSPMVDFSAADEESEEKILTNLEKLNVADRAIIEPLLQPKSASEAVQARMGASKNQSGTSTPTPASVAAPSVQATPSQASRAAAMSASAQDDWMSLVSGVYAAEQLRAQADQAGPRSNAGQPTALVNGGGKEEEGEEEEVAEDEDDEDADVDEDAILRQLVAANPEVAELLGRLDDANGAADGLERRLDGLLESLDGILERTQVNSDGPGRD